MNTLSVITSNYNHAHFISQSIESIVSQLRPPDEYLILDDGSTDKSTLIIESWAKRYNYIRLLRHEKNQGHHAATKTLLANATGQYVYGASADDYVLPHFFEKAMAMAERYPQAGIIFGNFIKVDEHGKEICSFNVSRWNEPRFATPAEFLAEYLNVEPPAHSLSGATIYRRSCLEEVGGFRTELGSWCDTFAIRAIGLKYGACYIPEPFMCWRQNPTSLSHATGADVRRMLDIIARATWLMRSAQFRDRFPAKDVRMWEKSYRDSVIRESLRGVRQHHQERILSLLGKACRNCASSRTLHVVMRKLSRLLSLREELALHSYKGDLSCYNS